MDPDKESQARLQLASQRLEPDTIDASWLSPVPYQHPGTAMNVVVATEEFTHICPMTGLPDFGELELAYTPDRLIIELKSFKYYLVQYRQVGIFYEHVVPRILDDLFTAVEPVRMSLVYRVRSRGGVRSEVSASRP